MLNFLGLSSDSAGDLRRRRSRLGRFASEGTVELKVLILWGGVLKFWRWPSDSAGDLRRRRPRLGRRFSEGTLGIKVWGFRVGC